MGRKVSPQVTSGDRVKSLVRHINNDNNYFVTNRCSYHFDRPCLELCNFHEEKKYHCLYANHSMCWKSYSEDTQSCDIPEHFNDMIQLARELGNEYVLPFAGHFREMSGYTIGKFRLDVFLYPPNKIERHVFKETVFTMVVFLSAVCYRLGGATPNLKHFSFVYSQCHPVLCDIGSQNADGRERLSHQREHFNDKKWSRFMCRKTIRDVIRYLRVVFPLYFQKKKKGMRCVLQEKEACFDQETHELVCQSEGLSIVQVLSRYKHLIPSAVVRRDVIEEWIQNLKVPDDE